MNLTDILVPLISFLLWGLSIALAFKAGCNQGYEWGVRGWDKEESQKSKQVTTQIEDKWGR